jgi:hypothetical protein
MSLADYLRQQVRAASVSVAPTSTVETPHVQHYGSGASSAPGYSAQHAPFVPPAGYGVPAQGTPEYMAGYHAGYSTAMQAQAQGSLVAYASVPAGDIIWQAGWRDGFQAYVQAHGNDELINRFRTTVG